MPLCAVCSSVCSWHGIARLGFFLGRGKKPAKKAPRSRGQTAPCSSSQKQEFPPSNQKETTTSGSQTTHKDIFKASLPVGRDSNERLVPAGWCVPPSPPALLLETTNSLSSFNGMNRGGGNDQPCSGQRTPQARPCSRSSLFVGNGNKYADHRASDRRYVLAAGCRDRTAIPHLPTWQKKIRFLWTVPHIGITEPPNRPRTNCTKQQACAKRASTARGPQATRTLSRKKFLLSSGVDIVSSRTKRDRGQ